MTENLAETIIHTEPRTTRHIETTTQPFDNSTRSAGSSTQPAGSVRSPGTASSEFHFDEATNRKLIQLVCFLRQLNHSHDTEDADDDVEIDVDDDHDSTSVSALEGARESRESADSEMGMRQVLVDAISFVASAEQTAAHVVAVAIEELDMPKGIRFRLSMNSDITGPMMSELQDLSAILGQLNTKDYDETSAHERIFDAIIKMKKGNLATLLRGGHGPLGLIRLFEDARRNLAVLGQHVRYPRYSDTLKISRDELQTSGAYNANTHEKHMEAAWSYFNKLEGLCAKSAGKGKGKKASRGGLKIDSVKELVMLAYEGRHSRCFRYLLTQGGTTPSTRLYMMLRKLSRYWKSSLDLVKCARSKSFAALFKNIEFCAIPKIPAAGLPVPSSIGQDGLLGFLTSIGYNETNLSNYCIQTRQSQAKVVGEFQKLQRKELYVHAEIGLIFFYATHPELSPEPQIGCSKHACFLCNILIKHHPYFRVRNTHKKIYVGWGLPDLKAVIGNGSWSSFLQHTIQQTIRDMEKAVRFGFLNPLGRTSIPHLPDSSSGMSDTETADSEGAESEGAKTVVEDHGNHTDGESGSEAESEGTIGQATGRRVEKTSYSLDRYVNNDHDLSDSFKGMKIGPDVPSVPQTQPIPPDQETNTGECETCDSDTTRRCSKCNADFFCSVSCEDNASYRHAFKCTGRPIDSADHLVKYCYDDQIPDTSICKGFGFERCRSHKEKVMLFGLYIGVVKYHRVRSRTLHQWQQKDELAQGICRTFKERYGDSLEHVGGYYRWFLNNKHLVEASTPKPPIGEQETDWISLQKYLPEKDRDIPIRNLQPSSKREVAGFYATLRGGAVLPNPNIEMWQKLGFSTCRVLYNKPSTSTSGLHNDVDLLGNKMRWGSIIHEAGDGEICRFYYILFEKCTFEEFLKAYEQRSLGALGRAKGMGQRVDELERDGVMISLPKIHPSCYDLKQYVLRDLEDDDQPPKSAGVDYGFWKCANPTEETLWRSTYLKLFEQPTYKDHDLHQACISGKIYDYVKKLLPNTPPAFKRMSSNPYPWEGGPITIRWNHGEVPKRYHETQGLTIEDGIEFVADNQSILQALNKRFASLPATMLFDTTVRLPKFPKKKAQR